MADFKSQQTGVLWLLIILVLVIFAGALVYFSRNNPDWANGMQSYSPVPGNIRQPRTYTIFYVSGVFSPTNLRIHAGDSVRFQNNSNTAIRVITDSLRGVPDLAGFDSMGDIQPKGGVFTFTFIQAGTFGYYNFHNANEKGTVIVRP